MGDIGSAISGGLNSVASVYSAERNYQAQMNTNDMNYRIHQEDNQFNADEAEKARYFNRAEREAAQEFNAGQADLTRTFQSDEAEKVRQWQEDMYNKYQSPEALAGDYQRLGIAPASVLSGGGQMSQTSLPSGASASSSPASSSPASAASPAAMVAPRFDSNPVADFIAAFQSSQRTQAEVQGQQMQNEWQKGENKYAVENRILLLKQRNAQIESELSNKHLTDEKRQALNVERQQNEIQLEIAKASKEDWKQMAYLEKREKEENIKNLVLRNVNQDLVNQVTPKLLSSQYNLNNAQASAAVTAAEAAAKSAAAAWYNAETHEYEFKFDKEKWKETFKNQVEAQTKMYNSISDNQEAGSENTKLQTDWYVTDKLIQIGEFLLDQQTKRVGTLLGAWNGSK